MSAKNVIVKKNLTKKIPDDILSDIETIMSLGLFGHFSFAGGDFKNRKYTITLKEGETLKGLAEKILNV